MSLARIIDGFAAFIDLAAAAVVAALGRAGWVRSVQVAECEGGAFRLAAPGQGGPPFRLDAAGVKADTPPEIAAAVKGRMVELSLDPARFLFRPLELPKGAAAFLDGIVRAQIDRLTPWSPGEAAFGWTRPVEAADDRIGLTVAATARVRIAPHLDRLRAMGARGILVTTRGAGEGESIRVLDDAAAGGPGVARVRRVLVAVLAAAVVAASLGVAVSEIAGARLDADLDAVNARIAAHRRALMAARGGEGAEGAALRALERRKRERVPTVLVLEALSQVLPDHTYLTEMEIEGDKVQLMGISGEAPALIRLLEQSGRFSRATFAAPTTRQSGDPGERFHIEARITVSAEVPR